MATETAAVTSAPTGTQAAPATAASEPAKAEPVAAAPAAEPVKRGKDRHAEIKAKLAAATKTKPEGGTTVPAPAAAATPPTEAKKPEADAKKPTVGAVMRLTSENTKLTNRVAELEGEIAKRSTSGDGETIASLRERVKKDPAVLFDVFGADIDEDETKRLAKLNDLVLERADPASAKDRETRSEVEKLKAKLAEKEAEDAKRAMSDRDRNARAHTARVLTEGVKADDGSVLLDPAKYPYVNHLTKTGEVDAHVGVMHATRDLAKAFREENKREPTDDEIVTLITIAADEAEAYFAKRAKNWALTQPAPAPVAEPAPAAESVRRVPRTIVSTMGGHTPANPDKSKLSKAERHEAIRDKLRRAQQQSAPN
jgi:hypothetical protein